MWLRSPSVACIPTLVVLWSLWTDEVFALVRIPLMRPPRRPHVHHHHHIVRPSHPVVMMQAQDSVAPTHLTLRDMDDYVYAATVAFGSPPQNFTVLLDTGTFSSSSLSLSTLCYLNGSVGSADAWVPGQRCHTCGDSHRHFHRQDSQSFVDLQTSFDGVYGSGDAHGDVVRDTLRLGGHGIPHFVFALITSETGDIPVRAV